MAVIDRAISCIVIRQPAGAPCLLDESCNTEAEIVVHQVKYRFQNVCRGEHMLGKKTGKKNLGLVNVVFSFSLMEGSLSYPCF